MGTNDQIIRKAFDDCTMIWDMRYSPILICDIRGKMTSIDHVKYYFDVRNAKLLAGNNAIEKFVIINNVTRLDLPPPTVRKALGDGGKDDGQFMSIAGYVNVVPNALLRGVATAIQWIVGDGVAPVRNAANIEGAFKEAVKLLRGVDAPVPEIPESYSLD